MKKVNVAVIGVGYLGKFHAQKYANAEQANLVAVCDIDLALASQLAEQHQTEAVQDYRALLGRVDAVSIVAPTQLHHEIAHFFLENGVHVLLEKPIATTLEEAEDLIQTAKKNGALLQIGHLERFNNAIRELAPAIKRPMFIESTRIAPFKIRGADVNVVLDLMIHDIDIIQSLVKSDITDIRANGAPVVSEFIDVANARIEFANGCVANVTASRVSLKHERKMRIFQDDCYASLDLNNKKLAIHRKGDKEMFPGIPAIDSKIKEFDQGDALNDEILAYLDSILHGTPLVVSGEDGKRALATAIRITKIVREQVAEFKQHTLQKA